MKYFPLLLFLFLIISCEPQPVAEIGQVEGLQPIYIQNDNSQNLQVTPPKSIRKLGKIYYKDQMIFVSENLEGIHIIDNSDPFNPTPLKFIEIPGNRDIAIKGNILYADNLMDLVTFDISDLDNIQFLNRVENIYPNSFQNFPDGYTGFFECVDPTQGVVVGWEETTLNNPECWR